jgi:hypothetical protein
MIDLIRHSQFPSNLMHAAARGALAVPPSEMMEILVHLALHNKVFGEQARMTLAGWDEIASKTVAADPATIPEVLGYLITPKNVRPVLLPSLMENPSVTEEQLAEIARLGGRDVVETLLVSERVKKSSMLRDALRSNQWMRPNDIAALAEPSKSAEADTAAPVPVAEVADDAHATEEKTSDAVEVATTEPAGAVDPDEALLVEAIEHYLKQNAAELATDPNRPFQAIGGVHEEGASAATDAHAATQPQAQEADAAGHAPKLATALRPKNPPNAEDGKRDSVLQKIAKLDVKGRIHLAVRGGKEERSILIRDGTKLVALAVLDSPKISDGEVEGFALQKNVLEAVLRTIPLKRRFAKNYVIMRNLVYNPRTPLDLSLGLMKNLLIHDLKNLSGNKEVSETIRKLALRMYKQKTEKKGS